jgi:hypothetical protein
MTSVDEQPPADIDPDDFDGQEEIDLPEETDDEERPFPPLTLLRGKKSNTHFAGRPPALPAGRSGGPNAPPRE